MTGTGIRAEGMVSNVGLYNEMRTVSEYDGWCKRNVRMTRLRKAPFEDRNPGCQRGCWKPVVEDFQDVKKPYLQFAELFTLYATTARCGAGAWR